MKYLREFLFAFCWMLSAQIIVSDLGISVEKGVWGKYIVAIGLGLMWAFYFEPMREKRKRQDSR